MICHSLNATALTQKIILILFLFFFYFSSLFFIFFPSNLFRFDDIRSVCLCHTFCILWFIFIPHTPHSTKRTSCFFLVSIGNREFGLTLVWVALIFTVRPRALGHSNKLPTPFGWFNLKSDSMGEFSFHCYNDDCQPAGQSQLFIVWNYF